MFTAIYTARDDGYYELLAIFNMEDVGLDDERFMGEQLLNDLINTICQFGSNLDYKTLEGPNTNFPEILSGAYDHN